MMFRKSTIGTITIIFVLISTPIQTQGNNINSFSPELKTGDKFSWALLENYDSNGDEVENSILMNASIGSIIEIEIIKNAGDLIGLDIGEYQDYFSATVDGDYVNSSTYFFALYIYLIFPIIVNNTLNILEYYVASGQSYFFGVSYSEIENGLYREVKTDIGLYREVIVDIETGVYQKYKYIEGELRFDLQIIESSSSSDEDGGFFDFLSFNYSSSIIALLTFVTFITVIRKKSYTS